MLHCLRFSLVLRTLRGVSGLLQAEWSRCLFKAGLLFGEMLDRSGAASVGGWFYQSEISKRCLCEGLHCDTSLLAMVANWCLTVLATR
jgi:hypothetical protein